MLSLKDISTFAVGKSYTTSSCWTPQAGNRARIGGCSGAM